MTTRHTAEYARLSRRPVSAWLAALTLIPDAGLRCKVAAIVWWDWFADRRGATHPDMTALLDKLYLGAGRTATDADVRNALLALGYSEEKAERRSRTPNGDNDYARHRAARLEYVRRKRARERAARRLAKRKQQGGKA